MEFLNAGEDEEEEDTDLVRGKALAFEALDRIARELRETELEDDEEGMEAMPWSPDQSQGSGASEWWDDNLVEEEHEEEDFEDEDEENGDSDEEFKSGAQVLAMFEEEAMFHKTDAEIDQGLGSEEFNPYWDADPEVKKDPRAYFMQFSAPVTKEDMEKLYDKFRSPPPSPTKSKAASTEEEEEVLEIDSENVSLAGNRVAGTPKQAPKAVGSLARAMVETLEFTPNRTKLSSKSLRRLQEKFPKGGRGTYQGAGEFISVGGVLLSSKMANSLSVVGPVGWTCRERFLVKNEGHQAVILNLSLVRGFILQPDEVKLNESQLILPGKSEGHFSLLYSPKEFHRPDTSVVEIRKQNTNMLLHRFQVKVGTTEQMPFRASKSCLVFQDTKVKSQIRQSITLTNTSMQDLRITPFVSSNRTCLSNWKPEGRGGSESSQGGRFMQTFTVQSDEVGADQNETPQAIFVKPFESTTIHISFRPDRARNYFAFLTLESDLVFTENNEEWNPGLIQALSIPLVGFGGRPELFVQSVDHQQQTMMSASESSSSCLMLRVGNRGERAVFLQPNPKLVEQVKSVQPKSALLHPGKSIVFSVNLNSGLGLMEKLPVQCEDEAIYKAKASVEKAATSPSSTVTGDIFGLLAGLGRSATMDVLKQVTGIKPRTVAVRIPQAVCKGSTAKSDSGGGGGGVSVDGAGAKQDTPRKQPTSISIPTSVRLGGNGTGSFRVGNIGDTTHRFTCETLDERVRLAPNTFYMLPGESLQVQVKYDATGSTDVSSSASTCSSSSGSGKIKIRVRTAAGEVQYLYATIATATTGTASASRTGGQPKQSRKEGPNKRTKKKKKDKGRADASVHFKSKVETFPSAAAHGCVNHNVQLTNRQETITPVIFKIVGGHGVFRIKKKHYSISLNPRSFVYLPVKFIPPAPGKQYNAKLLAISQGAVVAETRLVGNSLVQQ